MGSVSHFLSLSGVVFLRGLSKIFDRGANDNSLSHRKIWTHWLIQDTKYRRRWIWSVLQWLHPILTVTYLLLCLSPTIGFTEYRFLFHADPIYMPFKCYLYICSSNPIYLLFKPYLYALQIQSICPSNDIYLPFKCCNLFRFCWNDFFGHLRWLIQ